MVDTKEEKCSDLVKIANNVNKKASEKIKPDILKMCEELKNTLYNGIIEAVEKGLYEYNYFLDSINCHELNVVKVLHFLYNEDYKNNLENDFDCNINVYYNCVISQYVKDITKKYGYDKDKLNLTDKYFCDKSKEIITDIHKNHKTTHIPLITVSW